MLHALLFMIHNSQKGFTLVELLIVVGIIAILATLIVSNLSRVQARTRDAKRIADMDAVKKYIQDYYSQFQYYPPYSVSELGGVYGNRWVALEQMLKNAGVVESLPRDPLSDRKEGRTQSDFGYKYGVANDLQHYMIKALLETRIKELENSFESKDLSPYQKPPGIGFCGTKHLKLNEKPIGGYAYCIGEWY